MSFNGALHMRTNHQIHCTSNRLVSWTPIVGLRNSERAPLTHCHQRAGSCAEQGALSMQGSPPDHPVAVALSHAYSQHELTSRYLTQLLDAREADFYNALCVM